MTSPLPLASAATASLHGRSQGFALDAAIGYCVLGLLLFGPLAFGAVEVWSISIIEVGTGVMLLLWAVRQTTAGRLEILGSPLFLPMLAFAALVVWQLVSGHTAYRSGTISAAMVYCCYGVLLFLVVQCLRRTSQIEALGLGLSAYGFAVAVFALLQGITSNGKLYWLRSLQAGGWIYGPYVNHNHYAGLMEMLTPIPLVISLASGVRGPRKVLAAAVAAVMASTIFLSGSRGGMVAFAVQMVLLACVLIRRRKSWRTAMFAGMFLLMAIAMLAWLGGADLADRLVSLHTETKTELSGGTRLTIDGDALRIFAKKPMLGWGLGAFPEIYPQFSTLSSNPPVGMAHNDYLQALVEVGALGFAALVWFLATLYRSAFMELNRALADINSAVTLAATLGVTGILVHSLVDFNLQIPANAALFCALCAVAAMEPRFASHGRKRRHRSRAARGLSEELVAATTASIG